MGRGTPYSVDYCHIDVEKGTRGWGDKEKEEPRGANQGRGTNRPLFPFPLCLPLKRRNLTFQIHALCPVPYALSAK